MTATPAMTAKRSKPTSTVTALQMIRTIALKLPTRTSLTSTETASETPATGVPEIRRKPNRAYAAAEQPMPMVTEAILRIVWNRKRLPLLTAEAAAGEDALS